MPKVIPTHVVPATTNHRSQQRQKHPQGTLGLFQRPRGRIPSKLFQGFARFRCGEPKYLTDCQVLRLPARSVALPASSEFSVQVTEPASDVTAHVSLVTAPPLPQTSNEARDPQVHEAQANRVSNEASSVFAVDAFLMDGVEAKVEAWKDDLMKGALTAGSKQTPPSRDLVAHESNPEHVSYVDNGEWQRRHTQVERVSTTNRITAQHARTIDLAAHHARPSDSARQSAQPSRSAFEDKSDASTHTGGARVELSADRHGTNRPLQSQESAPYDKAASVLHSNTATDHELAQTPCVARGLGVGEHPKSRERLAEDSSMPHTINTAPHTEISTVMATDGGEVHNGTDVAAHESHEPVSAGPAEVQAPESVPEKVPAGSTGPSVKGLRGRMKKTMHDKRFPADAAAVRMINQIEGSFERESSIKLDERQVDPIISEADAEPLVQQNGESHLHSDTATGVQCASPPAVERTVKSQVQPETHAVVQLSIGDLDTAPKDLVASLQTNKLVKFDLLERTVLNNYFEMHDVDASRSLCISELMLVVDDMDRLPISGSQDENTLGMLFANSDKDQSGELDFKEFLELVEMYYHSVYLRIFQAHDDDNSNCISISELTDVMQDLEKAGFIADASGAQNVIKSADEDGNGFLDFSEFCHLMEQYRALEFELLDRSAGFAANTLSFLQLTFTDADENQSGSLDLKEIVNVLHKTNLGKDLSDPEALEEFVEIFSRVDKDRSATLDLPEFLRLVRVWAKIADRGDERKSKRMSGLCSGTPMLGSEVDATLHQDSMAKIKDEKAYYNYQSADAREDAKYGDKNSRKFYRVRTKVFNEVLADDAENRVLVKKHGLHLDEVEALREHFVFSDTDSSGMIGQTELPLLLKNCGCESTTRIQRRSLTRCLSKFEELKIELDFVGVVKLVVDYHDCCATAVVEQYNGLMEERGGSPVEQLVVVFYQVGQYLARPKIEELLKGVGFDINSVEQRIPEEVIKKMLEKCRLQKLHQWRATYGFKDAQIKHFQDTFEEYCLSRTQKVVAFHCVQYIAQKAGYDLYSEYGSAIMERFISSLGKGAQEVSSEQQVSWDQIFLLLRHLESQRMKEQVMKEHEAAQQCGMSVETCESIRKVFKRFDERGTGVILKSSIRSLFSAVGMAQTQKQRVSLRETLEEFPGDGMDFLQFLHTVSKLGSSGNF
eukprot:gnl/MRDRNA2_/MRDRNA2_77876_c0_seq1.p1 gnl/MRDRNA2_/MRDRNA2_77876_c0~~gnl/MRDRNA2_/MRDRNA2_77876_c0_seq1.p1  ORF type:complete len:1180 (-),score=205.82 gnl/MRDRNA2_/MRDRNA2_77876_c0_seq1:87-3626(-)